MDKIRQYEGSRKYSRILSIFTFILSFRKKQIPNTFLHNIKHGLFQTIYTYENLLVFAHFSINGRFCLVSLGNPTFSNIFPRARHVLMTFERYVHVYVSIRCIFLICSCHLSNVNYFDIQSLMMVTETETLTSTLHHNIFAYLDYVFSATFIYIYIYIYI